MAVDSAVHQGHWEEAVGFGEKTLPVYRCVCVCVYVDRDRKTKRNKGVRERYKMRKPGPKSLSSSFGRRVGSDGRRRGKQGGEVREREGRRREWEEALSYSSPIFLWAPQMAVKKDSCRSSSPSLSFPYPPLILHSFLLPLSDNRFLFSFGCFSVQ